SLATFNDRKRANLVQTNPHRVELESVMTERQDDDYSFDAVWQSESRLTADGYVMRFAIPCRSLRFAKASVQSWGIALARFVRRSHEEAYGPLVTKRLAGFVPHCGSRAGLRDSPPGRNVQATPYCAFPGVCF